MASLAMASGFSCEREMQATCRPTKTRPDVGTSTRSIHLYITSRDRSFDRNDLSWLLAKSEEGYNPPRRSLFSPLFISVLFRLSSGWISRSAGKPSRETERKRDSSFKSHYPTTDNSWNTPRRVSQTILRISISCRLSFFRRFRFFHFRFRQRRIFIDDLPGSFPLRN